MPKLPSITGKELVKFLKSLGFVVTRTKGSHVRMWFKNEKATTIPIHGNKTLPKGLLRKIIREDLEMSVEGFSQILFQIQEEAVIRKFFFYSSL